MSKKDKHKERGSFDEVHASGPSDILRAAAQMFEDRMPEYGDNYKRFPRVFLALFPDGKIPEITTAEDMQRLQLMVQATNKLIRYAQGFSRGGHRDSARDLAVYAAMLEEATS